MSTEELHNKTSRRGFLSGKHGGTEVYHHSVSSLVSITKTYPEEVRQGQVEEVTLTDWYDYAQIKDLFKALKEAHDGNLNWLLK